MDQRCGALLPQAVNGRGLLQIQFTHISKHRRHGRAVQVQSPVNQLYGNVVLQRGLYPGQVSAKAR